MLKHIPLENSWSLLLEDFFDSEAGVKLGESVKAAYDAATCYPPLDMVFNAFNHCKFDDVKVVIIGQDPYHIEGAANGMAFSTDLEHLPPSLTNIYLAIKSDYPDATFSGGDLTCLAEQGVLLLNSYLSVTEGNAMSHKKFGWNKLVEVVVKKLVERGEIVFMLWGQHAQKFLQNLGKNADVLMLKSVHPSPLSAYQGFFTNHHFKMCNEYLISKGKTPINWAVVPVSRDEK